MGVEKSTPDIFKLFHKQIKIDLSDRYILIQKECGLNEQF